MSDPAHPNVPFLVMRSTGDLPVEPTLLETDPPRDDDWDESGLGWRGFPRSDQPPIRLWGWWGLFSICAVAVVAMRIDPQQMEDMLKLVVTPLAVLFGLGAQPWLDALDVGGRVAGERAKLRIITHALLVGSGAGSIVLILVYVAMPAGRPRDSIGVAATALVIASILLIARRRKVLVYLKEFNDNLSPVEEHERSSTENWALLADIALYSVLSFVGVLLWVPAALYLGPFGAGSGFGYGGQFSTVAFVLFLYQLVTVGKWGRTLNNRMSHTTLVSTITREKPNWAHAAARATVFVAPLLGTYVFSGIAISWFGFEAHEVLGPWGPLGAVFYGAVAMHPRRQGVYDIVARTVAVREHGIEPGVGA